MPVIRCPHCTTSVEIHADDVGYKVLCPSCHSAFQAGDGERPVPESPSTAPEPEPMAAERSVRCAGCRGAVQVGVEDLGHTVECPLCGEKFRAVEETRSESPRDSKRRRAPNRSERFEDDDEDYDNDGNYGGRRRRRYREEDKGYILDTARSAIAWPANGLMWTGIVMLVLYLLGSIGLLIAGILKLDSPNRYERDDAIVLFIFSAVVLVFGGAHGFFMALSGYKMKRLRSVGWGYTAASIGIATIGLSHPCFPTTWAAVAFGIWAIVALNKREVKDAIAINNGKRL